MEEDSNLDDFFAKKDKSKKKNKTKDAGVSGEKTVLKKKVKKKKESSDPTNEKPSVPTGPEGKTEDAEWNDYEDEEKDLTGLRIHTLQLCSKDSATEATNNDEDAENRGDENEDNDEEGDSGEKRDRSDGPWNKSNVPKPAVIEEPEPVVVETVVVEPAKPAGKYMPPGMRRAAMEGNTGGGPTFSRKKKVAPDLHSDLDFPTLGGGPGVDGDYGTNFEQVKSGGRMEDGRAQAQRLELGNKFGALTQD